MQPFHRLTVTDFLSNGYALVGMIFVAMAIRSLCVWTSTYVLVMAGVQVKNAIQVSLCLAGNATNYTRGLYDSLGVTGYT